MAEYILSLYTGSLFLLIFVVSPVLLKTEKNKNIAGHFYGKILWRFYGISLFLLLIYTLLFEFTKGLILILGLGANLFWSKKLKEFKRRLGDIEKLDYYHPDRVRFRNMSYVSLFILFINFLLASFVLIKTL
ncbi:hypothetical protein JCM9492_11670 [Aquifex pyrophilus]